MARKNPGRVDASQVIHFPKAGIDRSGPFGRQPARQVIGGEWARTCYLGNNVRAYDLATGRLRGASRAGLTRIVADRPTGSTQWIIQELNTIVTTGTTEPGGGVPQTSNSGRVVTLVAVSQGNVYILNAGDTAWTTPTNSSATTPALNVSGVMQSAQNNQKLYIVDGTHYRVYTPATNAVTTWTASNGGTLPTDSSSNAARLICTWRGRTVLSGILKDAQNWFMSKVSDPLNYDYSPVSPSADQAVAGNNSPLGYIGDVVTGLCPFSDDRLIFFGDHTIYLMQGDPMAGGQIDLVSDAIGACFGKAWAKDPYGNVYFLSNRTGLYRMSLGSAPVRISQGIEELLGEIDTGETVVRMEWNDQYQGLHVFVTTSAEPNDEDRHFFFEMRTGGWFTDSFVNEDFNPVASVTFDGNLPEDRKVLIGSWDGYVRYFDPEAEGDDGRPIESEVLIGPINTPAGDTMMLHDLTAALGEDSGKVTWEVLVGSTAEAALASEAVASGTWEDGLNLTDVVRYSGHAVYLRLKSKVPWAMESIRARISTHGKVRQRDAY